MIRVLMVSIAFIALMICPSSLVAKENLEIDLKAIEFNSNFEGEFVGEYIYLTEFYQFEFVVKFQREQYCSP